ncbi:hypothetical protein RhiirA5_439366 [Rhizophagus irregularis]|uniref:Uncharacterized protein n=1 Tax=Rhizophagus irregularis TaxID=588596 RepID=A0A2N0NHX8_9GLOM|nr:hypothetical protein RhiirA5_439366 [Rhizophagus irregularis]
MWSFEYSMQLKNNKYVTGNVLTGRSKMDISIYYWCNNQRTFRRKGSVYGGDRLIQKLRNVYAINWNGIFDTLKMEGIFQ